MATAVVVVVTVVAMAMAVAAVVAVVVVAMVAEGGSDAALQDMIGNCRWLASCVCFFIFILLYAARRAMCCRSNSGVLHKITISGPRPAQPVADGGVKMKDYTHRPSLS